jgi:DNA polymerase
LDKVYLTNVVKHFKFEERGKRRIHKKPGRTEIVACRPWLNAELEAIRPDVVVSLGATAAQAIMGSRFQLMKDRGRFLPTSQAPKLLATLHPSAVLRAPERADRHRLYRLLTADFRVVASELDGASRGRARMARKRPASRILVAKGRRATPRG